MRIRQWFGQVKKVLQIRKRRNLPWVWYWSRSEWEPRYRWLPTRAFDEYQRSTVVLPVPFFGWIVIVYREKCRECIILMDAAHTTWETENE